MQNANTRLNLSAGIASVTVAVTLIGLKLWALLATGALSVAASLADNLLDLAMSGGALAAIAYAARPADHDHAFGHTSAEDLAAFLQSLIVLGSAGLIGTLAILRAISPDPPRIGAEGVGIAVMLLSLVLTAALVLWLRHVARRTGNRVVAADALHYLSDLLPTAGVLAALAASALWGVTHVDTAVALVAAAWLAVSGLRIGRGAWDALMDRAAEPEVLARIRAIADDWPRIAGWHDLKTRTAGSRLFISLHVEIDGRITLNEAHAIADGLEHALESAFPDAEVIIHTDPVGPGSGRQAKG
ncbi:cation diffusion facilitator family transporter [Pararhodobacter sp. SW119]|uniref:cation diffusion facilitator family transporter n=1 Tax=Pararhodobacter sp. SW119 TaxID=2780075 RepID=UPI001ADF8212|nr:cation diffusion facilitator family transporter [Pararhodobacter sp. SW119]